MDVSDTLWDGVPDPDVSFCGVVNVVCRCSGSGWSGWDVVLSLLGVSGWVFVDVADWGVVVVVLWSVELAVLVDERMHFRTYSESVEAVDVQDIELFHEWSGVCSKGNVFDESYDLFLDSDWWMYCFLVSDVPHMEMQPMRCGYACV